MALPSDTVLTNNTYCRVGALAPGTRIPPLITLTTSAAVVAGDTSIPITAAPARTLQPLIQEGDIITFGSGGTAVTVTVTANVASAATAIPIQPCSGAIASGVVGTTYGLLRVLGGESASFSLSNQKVPTRSFESGRWDDQRKVSVSGSIPWQGHYKLGDPAINLIIEPAGYDEREVFVELTRVDGARRFGAATVDNFSEETALDNIIRLSWTFMFVGTVYRQIVPNWKPYTVPEIATLIV
jgi:hypothetical protein